jgi:hypothetical protein
MARLYAATGDGIARLDEAGDVWTVELSLPASGAHCLAVDPTDFRALADPNRPTTSAGVVVLTYSYSNLAPDPEQQQTQAAGAAA